MNLTNYPPLCSRLSDCIVFSLGTSSCDHRLISVSEGRRAIISLLYHQCFHALNLPFIYILFARGTAGLWSLSFTQDSLAYQHIVLFMWYSCFWTPLLPWSASPPCHIMVVHASKAVMVLISPECNCEDWLDCGCLIRLNKTGCSLTNQAGKNQVYLSVLFLPSLWYISLFLVQNIGGLQLLSVCFCNFIAVILHLNVHLGWIMYLITSDKYCRHKSRHDVMIKTFYTTFAPCCWRHVIFSVKNTWSCTSKVFKTTFYIRTVLNDRSLVSVMCYSNLHQNQEDTYSLLQYQRIGIDCICQT